MSTQRVSSVKIPQFDQVNYDLWKRKMRLFLRAANPKYTGILATGALPPDTVVPEHEVEGIIFPSQSYPKNPAEYSEAEKEIVSLDISLQLILVESLDPVMYAHVVNCTDSKQIWDTIEIINEGTKEVRENRVEILTSSYEHFRSNPGEGISEVFQRMNKLMNDLKLNGKQYPNREVNRKFLLTLPEHLEHRVTAIRESRDMDAMTLEKLYGILKTYELEQIQTQQMYGRGKVLDRSRALMVQETIGQKLKDLAPSTSTKEYVVPECGTTSGSKEEDDDFYTLEELDQLEDESLACFARRFGNMRFKKNSTYKVKPIFKKFQKGGSSTGISKSGYQTGTVDRGKIRCFNCNELGHFATECKKPKQQGKRRDSYEDLKKKYDALAKKHQGKSYLAEGKSWDDSDSDDEEELGNLALMASSSESNSPPLRRSPPYATGILVDTSDPKMYKLVESELTNARDREKKLKVIVEELKKDYEVLRVLKIRNDKVTNKLTEDLANEVTKVSHYVKNEIYLKNQIEEEKKRCLAYKNSAYIVKNLVDQQEINRTVGIGFEYNKSEGKPSNITPFKQSAKERGIPHVLKDAPKPLFITPIAEPILDSSIVIDYEMKLEDQEEEEKREEKRKGKQPVGTERDIKDVNVQQVKWAPRKPETNEGKAVLHHPGIGAKDLKKNENRPNKFVNGRNSNNRFHSTENFKNVNQVKLETVKTPIVSKNLLTIDACHKQCGVVNCMQCAFNVMSAQFKRMHATYNMTTPREHINHKHARSQTGRPPASQKKTYLPKSVNRVVKTVSKFLPKSVHKVVKTVYKEKGTVKAKVDTIRLGSIVKPNKGQFFKYAGPNQVWVPKKI